MTLTFQKTITETKEVDIQFPVYYRGITNEVFCIKDENTIIIVYAAENGYFSVSTCLKHDVKKKIYELVTGGQRITAAEFGTALIKASEMIAECLPDGERLMVNQLKKAV